MNDGAEADDKKQKGFHFRMPPGMRERIDASRKISGRSVNAELVALVDASLDKGEPDLIATIDKLRQSVDALTKRLDEK